MAITDKKVPLFCNKEKRVIGYFLLPLGEIQLTSAVIIANFLPAAKRYNLTKSTERRRYVLCPYCNGRLFIRAISVDDDDTQPSGPKEESGVSLVSDMTIKVV